MSMVLNRLSNDILKFLEFINEDLLFMMIGIIVYILDLFDFIDNIAK